MCVSPNREVPVTGSEHFFVLTMEFNMMCKNSLFLPSSFTDGHKAECTFRMDDESLQPMEIVHIS